MSKRERSGMSSVVSIAEFDEAVAAFKAAWERADSAGLSGHRVENGIQKLISLGWRPGRHDDA